MKYDVPGVFMEGKNDIPFDSEEVSLSAVEKLYHNPNTVYAMKQENEQYYRKYLEPCAQLRKASLQCEV